MLDELYTLNESSTTDAIKIAKKLRSVSRVNKESCMCWG